MTWDLSAWPSQCKHPRRGPSAGQGAGERYNSIIYITICNAFNVSKALTSITWIMDHVFDQFTLQNIDYQKTKGFMLTGKLFTAFY